MAYVSPTASFLNSRVLPPAASLGAGVLGNRTYDENGELFLFFFCFFLLRDAKSPKSLVRLRELQVFSSSEGQALGLS